jgi:AraC-like DNA-binding protein
VCDILIEPETIDAAGLAEPLRAVLQGEGMLDTAQSVPGGLLERLCEAHDLLASQLDPLPANDAAFDTLVFGTTLPKPALDPRIIAALETLKDDDALDASAQELADRTQLSFHRFLHLFSDEVGVPLRTFRSWKRARVWLKHVTEESNLTEVAHRIGYPDSAHFSRSVRQVFGLQPKDVIAGCRRLALYREPRKPSER